MLEHALLKRLNCPVPWELVFDEPELAHWLRSYWYAVACASEVDGEVRRLFDQSDYTARNDRIVDLEPAYELPGTLHNVLLWSRSKRLAYRAHFRRLYKIRAADSETYNKHYVTKASTPSDIQNASAKRGAGVLLAGISPSVQQQLLWGALCELVRKQLSGSEWLDFPAEPQQVKEVLDELFGGSKLTFSVDFRRPMGATKGGLLTNFACLDLDLSTPQFHIYPISKEEFRASRLSCNVKGWDYGL